jgi:hypothetical protein
VLDAKTGRENLTELRQQLIGRKAYYAGHRLMSTRGRDLMQFAGEVLAGGCDLFENQHMRETSHKRTNYKLFFTTDRGDWLLDPAPSTFLASRIAPACDQDLTVMAGDPRFNLTKREWADSKGAYSGPSAWQTPDLREAAREIVNVSPIDKSQPRLAFIKDRMKAWGHLDPEDRVWHKTPSLCNALALAGNAVLIAHATGHESHTGWPWPKSVEEANETQYWVDGWQLSAVARETGEELWHVPLPSEPLLNGIAVARNGSVIVTLRDGRVLCAGERKAAD